MVSVVDMEDSDNNSADQSVDIMAAEIVRGKPYSCPALRSAKGKEVNVSNNRIEYSFDISMVKQIFDYLLKDQQI